MKKILTQRRKGAKAQRNPKRESFIGFVVPIIRKDGSWFMASGNDGPVKFFWKFKEASSHRRELNEHGFKTGKPLRVRMKFERPE